MLLCYKVDNDGCRCFRLRRVDGDKNVSPCEEICQFERMSFDKVGNDEYRCLEKKLEGKLLREVLKEESFEIVFGVQIDKVLGLE